jgi:hypothetical protein
VAAFTGCSVFCPVVIQGFCQSAALAVSICSMIRPVIRS